MTPTVGEPRVQHCHPSPVRLYPGLFKDTVGAGSSEMNSSPVWSLSSLSPCPTENVSCLSSWFLLLRLKSLSITQL